MRLAITRCIATGRWREMFQQEDKPGVDDGIGDQVKVVKDQDKRFRRPGQFHSPDG